MPSLDQAETVKQLLSEGWIVAPPTGIVLGGPITLARPKPNGTSEQITVAPDGKIVQNAGP
jgi:hypothetical protein